MRSFTQEPNLGNHARSINRGWRDELLFIHGVRNTGVKTPSSLTVRAIRILKTCLGCERSCACMLMLRQNLEEGTSCFAEDTSPGLTFWVLPLPSWAILSWLGAQEPPKRPPGVSPGASAPGGMLGAGSPGAVTAGSAGGGTWVQILADTPLLTSVAWPPHGVKFKHYLNHTCYAGHFITVNQVSKPVWRRSTTK